jgi:DNA-directed RNA polymerase subunit RPC12/RpoP
MAKCVRCGIEIESPTKMWNMKPKDGRGPALHIKHYRCPQCGKSFRIADKIAGA